MLNFWLKEDSFSKVSSHFNEDEESMKIKVKIQQYICQFQNWLKMWKGIFI